MQRRFYYLRLVEIAYLIRWTLLAGLMVTTTHYAFGQSAPVIDSLEPGESTYRPIQGEPAELRVIAQGSQPLAFQWFRNDSPIEGETNATLLISSTDRWTDNGHYQVEVSNDQGRVRSDVIHLVVSPRNPPRILYSSPDVELIPGMPFTLEFRWEGSLPLEIDWYKDGRLIRSGSDSRFHVDSARDEDGGDYVARLRNAIGSDEARFTVTPRFPGSAQLPTISHQPQSQEAYLGDSVTVTINAQGTPPVTYELLRGTTVLATQVDSQGEFGTSFYWQSITSEDLGTYKIRARNIAGTTDSLDFLIARRSLTPPRLQSGIQPQDQNIKPGENLVLHVFASGTQPLAYQWLKDGAPIPNATSPRFEKSQMQESDSGSYQVSISNYAGILTTAPAIITVGSAAIEPPVSSRQSPDAISLFAGESVSLYHTVTGSEPKTYVWRKGEVVLPDATSASLYLSGEPADLVGDYFVVVTNAAGTVTEHVATVVENPGESPSFLSPADQFQFGYEGDSIHLSVSVAGKPEPSLQWYHNGEPITGAHEASLVLESISVAQAGTYQCIASNPGGEASSGLFTVAVEQQPPLQITRHPSSYHLLPGESVSINATTRPHRGVTFQWYRDGSPIAGAANSYLGIDEIGAYSVTATRGEISVTSKVAVISQGNPDPMIVSQSGSMGLTYDSSYYQRWSLNEFSLASIQTRDVPTAVTWTRNGVALPEQSDLSLWVADLTEHFGTYVATVTTEDGTFSSAPIEVSEVSSSPPTILQQSSSATIAREQAHALRITAVSPSPMGIQWYKDGNAIAGADQPELRIENVGENDAATYFARVSNALGSTDSSPIELTLPVIALPQILEQPRPVALKNPQPEGERRLISVSAQNYFPTANISYQWYRDNQPVEGATQSQIYFSGDTSQALGAYQVEITNAAGSIWSNTVQVTRDPESVPLEVGYHPVSFRVGPSADIELSTTLVNQTGPFGFQWNFNGTPIPGATSFRLELSNLADSQQGIYTVTITNGSTTVTSRPASVEISNEFLTSFPGNDGAAERLSNLSTRARISGDGSIIVGFVVSGTRGKFVLVRAVGPTLADYGVASSLSDPYLRLFRGETELTSNDNWWAGIMGITVDAMANQLGAFPLRRGSNDAALAAQLVPGPYTMHVGSTDGTGGIVLVEVYDAFPDEADGPRLSNLSTRGFAGSDEDTLIAGFVVSGDGPKRLLIRGVGPTLRDFGVADAVSDPRLRIFSGSTLAATNDNWSDNANADDIRQIASSIGAFPLDSGSSDAAVLIYLEPGLYTAQVNGADGTAGEALVEVYELP